MQKQHSTTITKKTMIQGLVPFGAVLVASGTRLMDRIADQGNGHAKCQHTADHDAQA